MGCILGFVCDLKKKNWIYNFMKSSVIIKFRNVRIEEMIGNLIGIN